MVLYGDQKVSLLRKVIMTICMTENFCSIYEAFHFAFGTAVASSSQSFLFAL